MLSSHDRLSQTGSRPIDRQTMYSAHRPSLFLNFCAFGFRFFPFLALIYFLSTCFSATAFAEELLPYSRAEIDANGTRTYRSNWRGTRQWIGPHWWANPLYDWRLRGSSVIGVSASGRNLCFLPARITPDQAGFTVSISIRYRRIPKTSTPRSAARLGAGFMLGRRGNEADFRRALVYPLSGIRATITARGGLVLGNKHKFATGLRPLLFANRVRLHLTSKPLGKLVFLSLRAEQSGGAFSATLQAVVPKYQIAGGICLLSDGPATPAEQKRTEFFAFSNFMMVANKQIFKNYDFGPILWSQYTLNAGTLRLQAQLAPIERNARPQLWGEVLSSKGPQMQLLASSRMDPFSRTAVFTVKKWNAKRPRRYEVRLWFDRSLHKWDGIIRQEPTQSNLLKVAVFSCDFGYLFPHTSLVSQVSRINPDVVVFLGDQIYENWFLYGNTWFAPLTLSLLDCLYKNMRFGWTWRDILRNRPSIIIADDHDVFHANLWGEGGKAMPNPRTLKFENGGYIMPGAWVRAAEKIQVGHLPNPAVNYRSPLGITSYYTSMTYAGVGFAILEDRKFKSSPGASFNRRGTSLLGGQQEAFLKRWAQNWTDHAMKIALTQTIFASASTHQGRNLIRIRNVEDSGSWPREARDRVVRLLSDNNVLTVHGDQHLGILVKQGVKKFGDAGYSFMVPGTANGWPRAWWPGVHHAAGVRPGQQFTGKYFDDAGNPLTVLAVANPQPFSSGLPEDGKSSVQTAYRKGSGFGLVVLDKQKKTAVINLFRVGRPGEQFDGFPRTIKVGGNPRK